MIVNLNEKVHVIYRRIFETEVRRHFMGVVIAFEGSTVRLQGTAVIYDSTKNEFIKKPESRITIIDLAESGYIINILPEEVHLPDLEYKMESSRRLILTDGDGFSLDINEFGINR